jgi:D-glycero-D-manno-heptose 1,7-bisphosphate phosphatase
MERTGVSSHSDRAIFLDRDGTIVEDVDFLICVEDMHVLPRAPEALRLLKEAGFLLVVVTNQSAIARGWLTEAGLAAVHAELNRRLAQQGAAIDAFYHCPHLPGAALERYNRECECRKPGVGLLEQAAREWRLDLRRSYMVGDSERDMEAGRRAGCATILIRREPSGSDHAERADAALADAVVPDLMGAARLVLSDDWAK